MTSEEKMREEYEKFTGKSWHCHLDMTNRMIWENAWKASRESLVIELPPAPVPSRRDGTYTIAQSAYHQGQMSVEKSIHAAGVKTK